MLGAPLLRNDQVEGVLVIARTEPGAFSSRQIELVQTFADQAVIAVENARLFDEVQAKTRDLEESLQQQTATADVLKVISRSAFDLQTVFESLISTAMRLCSAKQGVIFRRQGEIYRYAASHMLVDPTYRAHEQRAQIKAGRGTLIGRVALENRAVQIPDAWTDPEYAEKDEVRLGNVRAMLGVPLMRNGEPIGAFALGRGEPVRFTERQVELVATFADQAVIAIENVRLFDEVQARTRDLAEALQQQTATADVLKVISRSAFDLPSVLRTLVESAAKLCDADKATITREVNGVYYRAETYGFSEEFMHQIRNIPVAPERGSITGLAMLEGKAIQVEDVEADPDYWPKNFAKPGELRTGLGIPMMRNGAPIGVLALMRTEVRPFNAKQIELVQTFADQAVIAIENARLFDEVQARTRDLEESLQQQTATSDILKVIASSPDNLQPVLDKVVETACRLCSAYDSAVLLREGDQLRPAAHYGPIPFTFASQEISRGWASGRAVIERRAIHIDDFAKQADEYPVGAALASQGSGEMLWRANLVMPLMRENEAVGVIGLRRAEPVAFSEGQIELLKTFADQAVIAIENVRLFDEVQAKTRDLEESLQQQTATADVLKVISRSAFDLQTVLDTLALSAAGLIGADFAVMNLRRDDAIRVEATFGCAPEFVQYLADHAQKPGRKTLAGRVFMSGEVHNTPDVLADPEYDFGAAPQVGNFRALLGVPIFRDGKVEGSFTLARREPGPFTQRQIELVQTFADQAVIAVENARLFDEVQAKTRDLAEALQQQTATSDVLKVISRSAFDLQAVFDTLIASAVELSGSHSGAICATGRFSAIGPLPDLERARSCTVISSNTRRIQGADPSSDARSCPDRLSRFQTFARTRNIRFR